MVIHGCNPSILDGKTERSRVQGHSGLLSKFEASVHYTRPCLKNNNKTNPNQNPQKAHSVQKYEQKIEISKQTHVLRSDRMARLKVLSVGASKSLWIMRREMGCEDWGKVFPLSKRFHRGMSLKDGSDFPVRGTVQAKGFCRWPSFLESFVRKRMCTIKIMPASFGGTSSWS